MWNYPVYYGAKYWYSFLYCKKCKKFTTHKRPTPQGGTFDISQFEWKCIECEKDEFRSDK